ncbi:MAG: hypothetical protein DME27_03845 [Verrucomicrobia bacterium]|nr:MAG: hypothetical protein DME27_03845 [Verrucomicrobiota bacterium]
MSPGSSISGNARRGKGNPVGAFAIGISALTLSQRSVTACANFSASMTISGPAPIIMAMYIAAAKRRFGAKVVPNLRGTIQADIFKEVQAQNETIFPTEASLRFLCDMIEWTTANMPRWYPVSISGYHIGEAGSTPVQQAAYTLSNGFAYAEMLSARGVPIDQFAPRLSFFLDCGLDVE